MLLLVSVSDKIQLVTSAAGVINSHVSWVDKDGVTITPGNKNKEILTAATTDISGSPVATQQRNVQTILARNAHATDPNTLTVSHTDGATPAELFKVELLAGESLQYVDGDGFSVFDRWGSRKSARDSLDYDSGYLAIPVADTDVTSVPTKVTAIALVNLTAQVQKITIKDKAGAPHSYCKDFKLLANETRVQPFYGMLFEGGISWSAETVSTVAGHIVGSQHV